MNLPQLETHFKEAQIFVDADVTYVMDFKKDFFKRPARNNEEINLSLRNLSDIQCAEYNLFYISI